MTKTFLLLLFIIIFSTSNGQIEKGDYTLTADFRIDTERKEDDIPLGGISLEYAATDYIGLNYTLLFSEELIHLPAGPLLTAIFLAYVDGYSFIIPEGISVNLKLSNFLYVAPAINLLGYEYLPSRSEDQSSGFVGGGGIKLKLFLNKHILFMASIEAQQQYNSNRMIIRRGFSFGAKF